MSAAVSEKSRLKTTSYLAPDDGDFAFDKDNKALAERIIARYPEGRQQSAVIPLLDLAQRQNGGWLSKQAIEHVAAVLEMAPIRVYEVVSFYTMFYDKPVGKHLVQVCRTTPCWLRGSNELTDACLKKLGTKLWETTEDGQFTVIEVECLGACANAPMVQINDEYYEDLTAKRMTGILEDLAAGKEVAPGPQSGRQGSAPEGGPATLLDLSERGNGDSVKASASEPVSGESLSENEKAKDLGSQRPSDKRDKAVDAQLSEDQEETVTPKQDSPAKEDS